MKVTDINSRDILLDKKKKENILICDISYKTLMGLIPLHNRFDEKDGCIKIYDGIRYLVLFVSGFNDETFDRIKYLMSKKKMVIQIVLIIILQESELTHISPYLLKKY